MKRVALMVAGVALGVSMALASSSNGVVERNGVAATTVTYLLIVDELASKKDDEGINLLLQQRKVRWLDKGTEVEVLDITNLPSGRDLVKVRIVGESEAWWMDRSSVSFK